MKPSSKSKTGSMHYVLKENLAEKAEYTGRILAVGIAYHKDDTKNFMNVRWRFFVRKLSDAVFLSMIFINFFSSLIF